MERKLFKYSLELAMLGRLMQEALVSENEYEKIKQKIMSDHKVVSHMVK